jgi:two-component system, sensor histidine kinase
LQDAVTLFEPRANAKSVALGCEIDPSLWAHMIGDQDRIRQVVLNLVSNAIKFTEKGAIRLRGRMAPDANGPRLRVEVQDTGIGIGTDVRSVLFKKFSQADSTTSRSFGGTGVGLAIGRELVELMGGTIDFESRKGEGSTFFFEIPLDSAPLAQPAAPAIRRARSSTIGSGAARVLVAEDNVINRMIASKFLQKLGFMAEVAEDGARAVALHRAAPYDIVLMDCQMPGVDGYQATALIRADERLSGSRVPIIAVTAHAMQGDRETCLAAGMDDYISKPLALEELRRVVSTWLSAPVERPSHSSGARRIASD